MSLQKRVLFPATSFSSPDQLQDHEAEDTLQAHSFCKMLGTVKQMSYLSAYAVEVFQNLSVLVEDVDRRSKALVKKTEAVHKKLNDVDKGLRIIPLQPDIQVSSYTTKYLKQRLPMTTPPIFVRNTNYPSILSQYKVCRLPPQLWRIENMIGEDCFQYFSFPGLFFQEWLKSELLRQQLNKRQRKKDRALRKQMRKEKRRLKEEALVSKYQSTQRMSALKKRALTQEAHYDQADTAEGVAAGYRDSTQPEQQTQSAAGAQVEESKPAAVQPTSSTPVAKKGGISAVFGFLTAKDKKKEETEEDDLDRSGDDLLAKSPTSSPPPPPPKPDSLSMQLLGKSGEQPKDPKFVQFDDQNHDASQVNEYPVDSELPNDVEDNQNAEMIDTEDLAKHFHFSINRRQARSHVSSKNAAKFMSKANREGAAGKGNNLLLQKKSHANDVILADYTPVNEAYGVRADDDSSQRTSRVQFPSSVHDNSKPSTNTSTTFAANAKKRASVIGVGGLSQIYKSNKLESKPKGTTESLLESIMADILSQQPTAFDEQSAQHKNRASFDREAFSIPEEEEEEFSEQFSEMESEISKSRSSLPSEPPPEDEDFSDAPPTDILDEIDIEDDDDLPPPDDDEELNLSNIEDDIPLSDPGQEENQSQLSFPTASSARSKPSASGPPPPPPPPKLPPKSALSFDVLSAIKGGGASLRTVESQPKERVVDLRTGLMNSIKSGTQLRSVSPPVKPKFISTVRQNEAVAAILANRSKIAGSDSESESDSDSDYTDDDYG